MKRQMAVLSFGAVFLVCTSALFAEDRLVPSVCPTIQAAIDDCNTGDAEHNKAPIPLPLGCQAPHTSALAGTILTALRRA